MPAIRFYLHWTAVLCCCRLGLPGPRQSWGCQQLSYFILWCCVVFCCRFGLSPDYLEDASYPIPSWTIVFLQVRTTLVPTIQRMQAILFYPELLCCWRFGKSWSRLSWGCQELSWLFWPIVLLQVRTTLAPTILRMPAAILFYSEVLYCCRFGLLWPRLSWGWQQLSRLSWSGQASPPICLS